MTKLRIQDVSLDERRTTIRKAVRPSGLPPYILEKDIWVVATLEALFGTSFAEHLIFKGGTSLSKAWNAIRRFSEDIDVTYDIRAFAADLVSGAGDEALRPIRSQEQRWTKKIRARLDEWVQDQALPAVAEGLANAGFAAQLRAEAHRLYVDYDPLFGVAGPMRTDVIVEFGARSTGEPNVKRPVVCELAALAPDIQFPEAHPTVLLAEKTFWEKATATHVFCCQERRRGVRRSRHWHDLARLGESDIAERAIADRDLALSVARHNAIFYIEKDVRGERIDYEAAVSGGLRVVPAGSAREMLAADYEQMLQVGMLFDHIESFDELMDKCAAIETRANEATR